MPSYHYSGKSTPEAIKHFQDHHLGRLPRPLGRIARAAVKAGLLDFALTIVCDGCAKKTRLRGQPKVMPDGRWRNSEWVHRDRLDFCEICKLDGTADRAVADGIQPLGTYTLD